MNGPRFSWFLPTGGDSRTLAGGVHGTRIGDTQDPPGGQRPASLAYLTQLAQAADQLGYHAVLTPTGAHCEDAWITTAALIPRTRRLRFLVALRPGLVSPVLTAQVAGTFARLSGGRLDLNVVIGSSDAEQRGYGDPLGHDERYARAAQFLTITRDALAGKPYDFQGEYYTVTGGTPHEPVEPAPTVYFGGSSPAALAVAAEHADVYLTWGEPPALVAEKLDRVRALARRHGRRVRFGIRLHVITRPTHEQARSAARALLDGVDDDTIAARQASLRGLDSHGQRRMLDLHGGDRDRLWLAPNLWAGIGLLRGGAGTALVGSHDEVAQRIQDYRDLGIEEFILSGYPHLEEAYAFAEGVAPLFPRATEGVS